MNDWHEDTEHIRVSRRMDEPATRYTHERKGKYLKSGSSKRHHRRHRRHRRNVRFIILIAALLALFIGITMGLRYCAKPSINGRWDLDGTTVYKFNKDGTGALELMYAEYEFTYTIDGDKLSIDFKDEAALDAKYTFMVEDRMLFLTGGPGDAKSEYVLSKIF